MKDLIVLVADKDMEELVNELIPKISNNELHKIISFKVYKHPQRDPGIFNEAHDFLRIFCEHYKFSVAMLDFEGCGQDRNYMPEEIENKIESNLSINGWENRNAAIAIAPELEQWIWVNETHIKNAISWTQIKNVYEWLEENSFKNSNKPKPEHPKEAFDEILKLCRTPRSSSLYQSITKKASYRSCTDRAFLKFKDTLINWFAS